MNMTEDRMDTLEYPIKYPITITVKDINKFHKRWEKMIKKACAATAPAIQKAMQDILDYQHDQYANDDNYDGG
jgi:hypothetical protein